MKPLHYVCSGDKDAGFLYPLFECFQRVNRAYNIVLAMLLDNHSEVSSWT